MSEAAAEARPSISFRVSTVMDRARMTSARKHDMRLGPQPGYVDADFSANNTLLSLTDGYAALKSAWSRRLDRDAAEMEARRIEDRKAKAMWRAGIITFSTAAQKLLGDKSPEAEAKATFEDFAKRHGVRLLWAVGHHDESAVHFHAMFENIRADGRCLRLNAGDLSNEQEIAATHFAHLGLVRGTKKADRIAAGEPPSKTINRSVKQLHTDLPVEIEAAQQRLEKRHAEIEAVLAKLATAQERAEKAEAKAKKYEGDADLALDRLNRYKVKIAELESKLDGLQQGLLPLELRESVLQAKEQALSRREQSVASREVVVEEFDDLLKGREKPEHTEFREEIETEEHGMPYFEAYSINNDGKQLAWWQKVAHIVSFWRDRFGLGTTPEPQSPERSF